MEFETRKNLWRKREELKCRIDGIFAIIIKTPFMLTDEDFKIVDGLIAEFEKCFKNTISQINKCRGKIL